MINELESLEKSEVQEWHKMLLLQNLERVAPDRATMKWRRKDNATDWDDVEINKMCLTEIAFAVAQWVCEHLVEDEVYRKSCLKTPQHGKEQEASTYCSTRPDTASIMVPAGTTAPTVRS